MNFAAGDMGGVIRVQYLHRGDVAKDNENSPFLILDTGDNECFGIKYIDGMFNTSIEEKTNLKRSGVSIDLDSNYFEHTTQKQSGFKTDSLEPEQFLLNKKDDISELAESLEYYPLEDFISEGGGIKRLFDAAKKIKKSILYYNENGMIRARGLVNEEVHVPKTRVVYFDGVHLSLNGEKKNAVRLMMDEDGSHHLRCKAKGSTFSIFDIEKNLPRPHSGVIL